MDVRQASLTTLGLALGLAGNAFAADFDLEKAGPGTHLDLVSKDWVTSTSRMES